MHIQVFNVQNFTTKILQYHGEDYAEKMGQTLKKIQQQGPNDQEHQYHNSLQKIQQRKTLQMSSGKSKSANLQAHHAVTRHYLFRAFQQENNNWLRC